MKPPSSKLQHQQQEKLVTQQQTEQKTAGVEFQSTEEALRADRAQTEVPEAVKTRLAESVSKEPRPGQTRSWWRRLLP